MGTFLLSFVLWPVFAETLPRSNSRARPTPPCRSHRIQSLAYSATCGKGHCMAVLIPPVAPWADERGRSFSRLSDSGRPLCEICGHSGHVNLEQVTPGRRFRCQGCGSRWCEARQIWHEGGRRRPTLYCSSPRKCGCPDGRESGAGAVPALVSMDRLHRLVVHVHHPAEELATIGVLNQLPYSPLYSPTGKLLARHDESYRLVAETTPHMAGR